MPSDKIEPCVGCGQLKGIPSYDSELWRLYHLLDDGGRKHIEPLVYTQSDLEEANFYGDNESREAVMVSMERNMAERGLCTECGRPDLSGKNANDFMSQEDADDLADMYAEMAAERRAGC